MAGNKNLTANFVKNAKQKGRYFDKNNTGLHLYVRVSGSKSWVKRIILNGKQIDIGSALQQHVKAEIDGVASKYAERPTDAVVVFSKSGHEFVCEATIHLSTGLTAQAKAHDNEIYASFFMCYSHFNFAGFIDWMINYT